jgi:ATP-binding cassette subfamily C protein CydC
MQADLAKMLAEGERVAIVGESGAGKSSLVNVLLRFWDYDLGQIRIGDTDLRHLSATDVRDMFGVMSQRTHLFNTTIRENIRLANPNATDIAIIQAAKLARIHGFAESLPEGYDTLVGENGSLLSDGQRQRIALARVLLKDAPIWILDEATANLDAQTEADIMQTVWDLTENRTLLLITHRIPPHMNTNRVVHIGETAKARINL